MTTTSKTWFYTQPERNRYAIAERVRTSFWDARYGGIWLDCVRPEPPIQMTGWWNGVRAESPITPGDRECRVELEWEPGKWLALRTKPAAPQLVDAVSNLLGFKPALTYEDADGRAVWEWHTDGGAARWQAIQGIPAYRRPRRLGR